MEYQTANEETLENLHKMDTSLDRGHSNSSEEESIDNGTNFHFFFVCDSSCISIFLSFPLPSSLSFFPSLLLLFLFFFLQIFFCCEYSFILP